MLTDREAAVNIVNTRNPILSLELQEKLTNFVEAEDVKLWAKCNKACGREENKVLLREMELAKKSTVEGLF